MKYPLFKVHMPTEDAIYQIKGVLNSGFVNEGKQVNDFKEVLKQYLSLFDKHELLCTNITACMHLDKIDTTTIGTCIPGNGMISCQHISIYQGFH